MATSGSSSISEQLDTNKSLLKQLIEVSKEIEKEKQSNSVEIFLKTIIKDIKRVENETLEIIPVSHYSLSSAVHVWQRLSEKKPKVIFLEAPEDFERELENIKYCTPPVAFQGILVKTEEIDHVFLPINSYTIVSEASAEYQAIKYAFENPGTELIFVDAPCTNRVKWEQKYLATKKYKAKKEEINANNYNFIIGNTIPTKKEFLITLLEKTNFDDYSLWWEQVAENALLDLSYDNYRYVMVLLGSVFRRSGSDDKLEIISSLRDKFMWNKIKSVINSKKLQPEDCVFICGAAHAIATVEEWGMKGIKKKNRRSRKSEWKYGINQVDYNLIDQIANKTPGSTSEIHAKWDAIKRSVYKNKKEEITLELDKYNQAVHDKILTWASETVKKARKAGYITSPADSIAIVELTYALKEIRNRARITPREFIDAAVTSIQKNDLYLQPVEELIDEYIFPNVLGKVGYKALPSLAKDVFDRLSILKISRDSNRVQRVLLDLDKQPELKPVSDLLWMLKHMNINVVPIAGKKTLGKHIKQESWDLYIYKNKNPLIWLSLEGISVEEVFRSRITKKVKKDPSILSILEAIKSVLTYLNYKDILLFTLSNLLFSNLEGIIFEDQKKLYSLTLELLNYLRTLKEGIPKWFIYYIVSSYRQYCQELVKAAADNSISAEQFSMIFSFIFKIEGIALTEGASREELEIAIKLTLDLDEIPENKKIIALAANSLLKQENEKELRQIISKVFWNPQIIQSASEIVLALVYSSNFAPNLIFLFIEFLDQCFRRLSDNLISQWLPLLTSQMKKLDQNYVIQIAQIVKRYYNRDLKQIEVMNVWYDESLYATITDRRERETEIAIETENIIISTNFIHNFIYAFPETLNQLCLLLGFEQIKQFPLFSQSTTSISSIEKTVEKEIPLITRILIKNPATIINIKKIFEIKKEFTITKQDLEKSNKIDKEKEDLKTCDSPFSILKSHSQTLEKTSELLR
ncbi:MAG: DUF5682 family protein [Candidatus Heimdallarchaeum endolithica]|uniref:DUF5682 family protein n=1 Tax=Candidatus Heimdallarchaeum endolithica TaxID=2876572 RepID=A0A9Y1BRY1_9ARCH|nr:MAG: DUF5682 family protein [Candidatus Heimdallarchaeum endolithica]